MVGDEIPDLDDSFFADGPVEQLDENDPRVELYRELLREPRDTLIALAAMPIAKRERLAEFLIIEEWTVRHAMDFATRGMELSLLLGEELTYADLVSLGPELGWTVNDVIDQLLTSYPRCSAIAGLDDFVLAHIDTLKARITAAAEYPELHPFFGHCWELPGSTLDLFRAELEAAAVAKGRRVGQRIGRQHAAELLGLADSS